MKTNYVSAQHIAIATALPDNGPKVKHVKRVGLWDMEWESHRPNSVWCIPERHKEFRQSVSGVLYEDGTVGWDNLTVPRYVRDKAARFIYNAQFVHARATKAMAEQQTEKE